MFTRKKGGDLAVHSDDSELRVARKPQGRVRRIVGAALMVTALTVGVSAALTVTTANSASAMTVRPGKGFGQTDILLDGWDMQRVAGSGYWTGLSAATTICWQSGIGGRVLSLGVCQSAVMSCALTAWFHHRWAGITATWWPYPNYWCWEY